MGLVGLPSHSWRITARQHRPTEVVIVTSEVGESYSLAKFGLRDMILAGQHIRGLAERSSTMQGAAEVLVRFIAESFVDTQSGERNCVLVRCFKTHRLRELPPELQARARSVLKVATEGANVPCLTLLATAGELAEWNDPLRSAGHAAIPLETVSAVQQAPMIAQLIKQLGLEIEAVLDPTEDLLMDAEGKNYGVFHVEEALGSSSVPAQEQFVRKFGVRSVIGFGGLLPAGELFAIIVFSRVRIPREVASLFRTIALSAKLLLLPFARGPVFASELASGVVAGASAARTPEQDQMRSEMATLRLLIPALEAAALYQTAQLEDVIADLNTQKQAFERLGTRLSSMLESTSDAVFLLDREWRFTYLNQHAAKLLQRSDDLLGRNVWEEFPLAAQGEYWKQYHAAMDEGRPVQFEEHYPEPLDKWFEVHAFPSEPGIAVFFHDVTARRKSEAALIKNEKLAAVGRLAASIAHEVNNPLESVTNLLYLARTCSEPADIQEYLATADRELRRVGAITAQTLRFYKQATSPIPVTCQELVDGVVSIYHGRFVNSRVAVQLRLRETRPVVCFDGEIRQVLNNLVANAVDAMHPDGGRLIFSSHDGMDWRTGRKGVYLGVTDTGPGMSPLTLRKATEPFFTTKGLGGTGLGLWISQEILQRHEGKLMIRSSQRTGSSGTTTVLFVPFDSVGR